MKPGDSTASSLLAGNSRLGTVQRVRIKVLGPLEVVVDGDRLALGGPQQRLVLAMLLSRVDAPVSTESLIDALWYEDAAPDRARKTVQVYVANLRKVLGGQSAPIESAPGGYVLRTGEITVDAIDFEQAVDATGPANDSSARETVERLSSALGLWNGLPYADLGDAPVLTVEVARLNELRLVALERRVEASLTVGRHREVLSEIETLTTDHPYRERFTALHMLALYRSGRQAEALRAYQRTRLVLGEELGIDPSPEVQALERAILTQDPSLDLTEASASGPGSERVELAADTGSIRGYELREQVGEGDETTLWRAYQPATGREVTLRIFGPEVANESTFVKRFEPEAQLVAQLEHPHLVSIYDFWRDPDGAYVVMPLLRGGTLERLSPWPRPLEVVGRAPNARPGRAALAALHRHGLSHGSLGPDCVFLDTDSNAYLADAGITGRATPLHLGRPSRGVSRPSVPTWSTWPRLLALDGRPRRRCPRSRRGARSSARSRPGRGPPAVGAPGHGIRRRWCGLGTRFRPARWREEPVQGAAGVPGDRRGRLLRPGGPREQAGRDGGRADR